MMHLILLNLHVGKGHTVHVPQYVGQGQRQSPPLTSLSPVVDCQLSAGSVSPSFLGWSRTGTRLHRPPQ